MKELELMTSEEYWDRFIRVRMATAGTFSTTIQAKDEIKAEIMKLIKLLKNEIPDYSTRFTH